MVSCTSYPYTKKKDNTHEGETMRKARFVGSRVVKTGVAVFLTSLICQLLNWPAVFAVITAIVTIEPTVADSIKKGIIRFPASAIGSAYAVLFIFLFGNSPVTYTAAAVFTIISCFKLKLHSGLLVATLTSVAMIEVIHSNFLISFFIRLGTTSIGLLVSTAVNMFILPPNYSKTILTNIHSVASLTGRELENIINFLLHDKTDQPAVIKETFNEAKRKLDNTDMLVRFQKDEAKYHQFNEEAKKVFANEQDKLSALRLIHYHLGNLINLPFEECHWTREEKEKIILITEKMATSLKNPDEFNHDHHQLYVQQLMKQFWESKSNSYELHVENEPTFFSTEIIILYELLSICQLVESFLNDEATTMENIKKGKLLVSN